MDTDARILKALLDDDSGLTALVICERAGLAAGTIHPNLARFEGRGWVSSDWALNVAEGSRPRPRLYRLTPFGRTRVRQALGQYDEAERT